MKTKAQRAVDAYRVRRAAGILRQYGLPYYGVTRGLHLLSDDVEKSAARIQSGELSEATTT